MILPTTGHHLGRWVPQLGRGAHSGWARWLGGRVRNGKQLPAAFTVGDSGGDVDAEMQLTQSRYPATLSGGQLSNAMDCRGQACSLGNGYSMPADLRCVSVSTV